MEDETKYTNLIRNIAIIAHVDHGKTTLVDTLLKQSGLFRDNQAVDVCMMDRNDQEKERGITILSKCTSIMTDKYRINILDTPGHADFSAEVERILAMVDGFILIVDSKEGVMPQTKFVLRKAMEYKLKPIVFVNKIDSPLGDPEQATEEVMQLLLDIDENSLDTTPIFYGSGRDGYAASSLEKAKNATNVSELVNKIIEYINPPKEEEQSKFLVSMVEIDRHLGTLLVGKVFGGKLEVGQSVLSIKQNGETHETFRISKIFGFTGISRYEMDCAHCGDIIAIAGCTNSTVNDTICLEKTVITASSIDPATISISFSPNTSILAGQEGTKLTSRHISERLFYEARINVGIDVKRSNSEDSLEVCGRGELQMGVLIETMRREGFELTISPPKILFHIDENGKQLEPIEEVQLDVDQVSAGTVIKKMSERGGDFKETITRNDGVRLIFEIPTRLLFGYASEFISDTRGNGVMSKRFLHYAPMKNFQNKAEKGSLISMIEGKAAAYALEKLLDRGQFFINPGDTVYPNMVIGISNTSADLEVNPVKTKQLTNMRASGKDDAIKLPPAIKFSLEEFISRLKKGEVLEVTPKNIRVRKI